MAVKTYLYRPLSLTSNELDPLLAPGANPIVGDPLPDTQVPITVDEVHKEDLDSAMSSFGYAFVAEYLGTSALVSRSDFGVLTANPTSPVPSAGDMYYNSALDMEMRYDSLRSKWLSIETTEFHFGRDGNTAPNQYYRAADGRVMSSTLGWYAIRSGTVVSMGYTRAGSGATTFDLVKGGTSLATVSSTTSSGRQISLNADFSFGDVLALRNSGLLTTSNVIGWARVKWRV